MGIEDTDSTEWTLNGLNSLVGNWRFAVVFYLAAFAFPQLSFLTIAVGVMAVLETVMHLVGFIVGLSGWYNPGLITVLMLPAVSLCYFIPALSAGTHTALDYVLGFARVVLSCWFVFRSPSYLWIGSKREYSFTHNKVMRSRRYIEACQERKAAKRGAGR